MTKPIATIRIKQDIGSYEPRYQTVELRLWPDGTVTWVQLITDEGKSWEQRATPTTDATL